MRAARHLSRSVSASSLRMGSVIMRRHRHGARQALSPVVGRPVEDACSTQLDGWCMQRSAGSQVVGWCNQPFLPAPRPRPLRWKRIKTGDFFLCLRLRNPFHQLFSFSFTLLTMTKQKGQGPKTLALLFGNASSTPCKAFPCACSSSRCTLPESLSPRCRCPPKQSASRMSKQRRSARCCS